MEIIKEKLIHLLGGVTMRETKGLMNKVYEDTRTQTLHQILLIMEGFYGKSADEWCRVVYDNTKKMFEDFVLNTKN